MDRSVYIRRRLALVGALVLLAGATIALSSRGASGGSAGRDAAARRAGTTARGAQATPAPAPRPVPAPAPLTVSDSAAATAAWRPVAFVHGVPAAWIAQRGAVTLLRFDQHLVRLDLHAGSSDGGVGGWRYGDQIARSEVHHVIAGFNGGFKLTYADVGFLEGGHVAAALKDGLASIVTYTDGTTDVGAWHEGVPAGGRQVFSVLQNQRLLVDRGVVAPNADSCISACWGETIKGLTAVARSGLGVRSDGQLVWAAGESLLPGDLGRAMAGAGVVRAAELDINPDWVAGYLYHHHDGPVPVPVIPGQIGIAGKLIEPYSRDFFVVAAR